MSTLFDGRSFLTNIFILFWSNFCNLIKKDTFTVNVSHIPLHVPIFLMKNWTSDRRDLLINIFWFKWTKKDSGYSSFYCVHFKLLLIYFVWRFLFQILIHLWMDFFRIKFQSKYRFELPQSIKISIGSTSIDFIISIPSSRYNRFFDLTWSKFKN